MSLHEAIHRMMNESTKNNSKFISLKDIYVHLKNKSPEASSQIIFNGFLYKYEHLKEKSALYIMNEGNLSKVNTKYRVISSQPSSFEGLGKYIPNSPNSSPKCDTLQFKRLASFLQKPWLAA